MWQKIPYPTMALCQKIRAGSVSEYVGVKNSTGLCHNTNVFWGIYHANQLQERGKRLKLWMIWLL